MGRTVSVKLTADITDLKSKLRDGGTAVRQFTGELDKAAKAGHLERVTDQAALMGAGLLAAAGAAVKMAADFDKAMSGVSAASHASAAELAQLRAAALQAGKDTQYSATDAANAITELSKAGVSTTNILNGGLKGALSLAAAGQLDVSEAAQAAASAMTQFKLSGNQIPHVADLLAAAAGKAQGSVHDMGYALNQSGLVASQFGLSVEDTTGALAEFASAGLIGSDAGTSLRTMLIALANPTQQTKTLMASLGISFYDAQGKFIGLSGVAQVLQTRLKGLTDAQRQQALGQIFGNDAIRSASILYTDGAAGVDKWKNAVNDSGYAAATAQKQTDNLAGDLERLRGSFETLAIESGSGGNSGLRMLVKLLNDVVNQFDDMSPATGEVLVGLAAITGALLLSGAAWLKYRKIVVETQEQLAATGPIGEKVASKIGFLSSALGKLGVAAAGLEAFTLALNSIDTHAADVDKLTSSLQNLVQTGQTAGALKTDFGANLKGLGNIAQTADDASHGFGGFMVKLDNSIPLIGAAGLAITQFVSRLTTGTDWTQSTQQMQALDQAMVNFMGTTNDAKQSSDLWNKVLLQSGLDTDQLAKLLPNAYQEVGKLNAAADQAKGSVDGYSGAAAGAAGSTGDLNSALAIGAGQQNKYATAAAAVAGAARGEREAIGALYSELKAQTDPVFGLIDSEQKLAAAQKAATAAARAHGAGSTEAKAADDDLAKAALDLQMNVGNLSQTFNGKLSPAFLATLKAAGLTKAQIADVTKQFGQAKTSADQYSGKYAAVISASGAAAAKKQIDDTHKAATQIYGPWVVQIQVNGYAAAQAKLQALKSQSTVARLGGGFADGGWTGPGSKWQLAGIVHADEYVVQKSARGRLEAARPGALDAMNQTGRWPGYAGGGRVGSLPGYASGGLVAFAPAASSSSGSAMDTASAAISAADAIAQLTAALKDNGRTFSMATQKGRDNRAALISGIKAAQDAAKATYDQTGSVAAANRVYDQYIRQLDASMAKMKVNAATRHALIKAYSERPTYDLKAPSDSSGAIALMQGRMGAQEQVDEAKNFFAWTKPTFVSTTAQGRAELGQLFSFLQAAQTAAQSTYDQTGSKSQAMAIYNGYINQLRAILGQYMPKAAIDQLLNTYGRITLQPKANRWGGVYEHAATGSLRDSQIAGGGPARYMWAEPETGGELFAPKHGNLAKTRADVGWAVSNWWGGQVSWQPGGAAASAAGRHMTVHATIPITLGSETITRQVRLEVDAAMGQVVDATVYQTA